MLLFAPTNLCYLGGSELPWPPPSVAEQVALCMGAHEMS